MGWRIIYVFPRHTFDVNLKGRVRQVWIHFVNRKGFCTSLFRANRISEHRCCMGMAQSCHRVASSRLRATVLRGRLLESLVFGNASPPSTCKLSHATQVDDIKVFTSRFHACALSMETVRCDVSTELGARIAEQQCRMDGYGLDRWHVLIKLHSSGSLIAVSISRKIPTLVIEANLNVFLLYLSNVFIATCRAKLDLPDLSIWLLRNCVLEQTTAS